MTTAARLAALEAEYAEKEARGEYVAQNDGTGYVAPGLQARLQVQRVKTGKLLPPDTAAAGEAAGFLGGGPKFADDGPQIWRATATPWHRGATARPRTDDNTPVYIPPSIDPHVQLVVPAKGSPRGDVQAEKVEELGSFEAMHEAEAREEMRSARGGRVEQHTYEARNDYNDKWAGVARGGRRTPPKDQRRVAELDGRGRYINAQGAEEWISTLEGGKGGEKDNWHGARHDFTRIQRAASGVEGLLDERVTSLLDGLKRAEAEGAAQLAAARMRRMVADDGDAAEALEAGMAILPHGWWTLTMTLLRISDLPVPDPKDIDPHDYHGRPNLNIYCEISSRAGCAGGAVVGAESDHGAVGVGGAQFHRWECVQYSELKEVREADGIHNNVAEYDGVQQGGPVTWTFDQNWGGHELEISVYHWPKQALDTFTDKASRKEYSKLDCWGVPTHTADGLKINSTFRAQLAAQVHAVAAKYPKLLLGRSKMGLEWFREAGRTGIFNLFLDNMHVTYGGKQSTVEIRLQPTVPRAQTAAELRSLLARRQRTARTLPFSSTPVPYARPFLPSRGPSRWGTSTAGGSTRDAESPHTQDANRLAGSPPCDAEQQPQRIAEAQDDVMDRANSRAFGERPRAVTTAVRGATSLASDARPATSVAALSPPPPQTSPSRRQVMFVEEPHTPGSAEDEGGAEERVSRGGGYLDASSPLSSECKAVSFQREVHVPDGADGGREDSAAEVGQGGEAAEGKREPRQKSALRVKSALKQSGNVTGEREVVTDVGTGEERNGTASAGNGGTDIEGHEVMPVVREDELGTVIGEVKVQSPVEGGWGFEARGSNEMPLGLLYELGSWGRTQPFENPAVEVGSMPGSGMIRVSSSSPWARGSPECVTARDPTPCISSNEQQAWVCLELPVGMAMYPEGYTLRHGLAGPGRALRHWELQGSSDGRRWVPLKEHRNDWALHSVKQTSSDPTQEGSDTPMLSSSFGGFALCTFNLGEKVDTVIGGFADEETWAHIQEVRARNAVLKQALEGSAGLRFLKITATGPDSGGSLSLSCSGLEFYGRLVLRSGPVLALLKAAGAASRKPQLGALVRTLRVLRMWCQLHGPNACGHDIVAAVEALATHADAQVVAQVKLTLELIGPRPCVAYQHKALVYTCQGDAIDPLRPELVKGTPPRTFSIHPPLPQGLEIIPDTGVVWGTATEACRRTSHTVTLTCASGSDTAVVEVHVLPRLLRSGTVFRYLQPKPTLRRAKAHAPTRTGPDLQLQDAAGDALERAIASQASAGPAGHAPPEPASDPTSMQGGPGSVGLMHFLSTCGLRKDWCNPALNGSVQLSSSDWLTDLHFVLGEHGRLSSSHSKKDSWFSMQLPRGLWLLPHRYSLRHGYSSGANALRNWELQGSADGQHWVCLRSHENDSTLDQRFGVGTWGVGYGEATPARGDAAAAQEHLDATGVHRFFRVFMTGINSSKGRELRCSGFEIYGQVFVDEPVSTMASPLWYLREWALEALLNSLLYQRAQMMGAEGLLQAEAGGFTGLAVPDATDVVRAVREMMGIDARGFEEAAAGMATGDVEPDLRVAALGAMSILAASPTPNAAGGPAVWLQSALASLEDDDGMVREAALLALQALAPPADVALISNLLPRIYHHHLRGAASAAQSSAASPLGGRSPLQGEGAGARRGPGAKAPGRSLRDSIIPAAAPSRPWRQTGIGAPARAPAAETAADSDGAGSKRHRTASEAVLEGLRILSQDSGMHVFGELLTVGANARKPAFGRRRMDVTLPPLESVQGAHLWFVRDALLEVLTQVSERGDPRAHEAALMLMSDPSPILRRKAAVVLGKVSVRGEAATAQKLIEAVGDADEGVREAAARSLTLVASADAMGQVRDIMTLAAICTGVDNSSAPVNAGAGGGASGRGLVGATGVGGRVLPGDPLGAGDSDSFLPLAPPGQRLRAHLAAASYQGGGGSVGGGGGRGMPAGGWDGGAGVRSLAERSRAQKDALVDAFYHIKDSVGAPISNHRLEPSSRHLFTSSEQGPR